MSRVLFQTSGPSLLRIGSTGLKRASREGWGTGEVSGRPLLRKSISSPCRPIRFQRGEEKDSLKRRRSRIHLSGYFPQIDLSEQGEIEDRRKSASHLSGYSRQKKDSKYSRFQSYQRRAMSWLSRGTSNADLIQQMQRFGAIKSSKVADVMREVDRGLFTPPSENPYQDAPQPIGFNATISGLFTIQNKACPFKLRTIVNLPIENLPLREG